MSDIDLSDLMVKQVTGHPDVFAFQFDFIPESKSLDSPAVTEQENGDLVIEGYAAVFDGVDREGENFADGAFNAGIKSFLEGQAGLCFHHKHDKLLGRVLELHNEEGKGLKIKARVDGAIAKHPELGVIYEQIKKGSLNALSVGGFFKRAVVGGLQKITGVDFTEISVTPVPVHPGTNFAVVAGKALTETDVAPEEVDLSPLVDQMEQVFADLSKAVAARTQNTDKVTT